MPPRKDGRQPGTHMPQYVTIGDEQIEVPHVYPVWLPGTPPPWVPAPKPYDERAWTEWGRAQYGETWYDSRQKMLRERNIYSSEKDHVYLKRQRRLRAIEDAVEGRQLAGGMRGTDWKHIWASQKAAPPTETCRTLQLDAENSGVYLTASSISQAWKDLMRQRDIYQWSEEEYGYQSMELGCKLLLEAKNRCEDVIGDRKSKEVLDKLNNTYDRLTSTTGSQSRYDDQSLAAHDRALYYFGRLRQGDPRDQVMSDWAVVEESVQRHLDEPPEEEEAEVISQEAFDQMINAWRSEFMTSTDDNNNTHRPSTSGTLSRHQSQSFSRPEDAMYHDSDHGGVHESPNMDSDTRCITGPPITLDGEGYADHVSDIDMDASMPEEAHSLTWSYDMGARYYESMSGVRDTTPAGQWPQDTGKHTSPSASTPGLFGRRRPSPTKPHSVSLKNLCGTIGSFIGYTSK